MWNPNDNSNAENLRWCHLRAVEWVSWPIFIAQPIVPIALLFYPWWVIASAVLSVSVLWELSGIAQKIVAPRLAYWGALFIRLKFLASPLAAAALALKGFSWLLTAVVLVSPAAMYLLFVPMALLVYPFRSVLGLRPTMLGNTEMLFARSLGYAGEGEISTWHKDRRLNRDLSGWSDLLNS
jgi:hypothetical protein